MYIFIGKCLKQCKPGLVFFTHSSMTRKKMPEEFVFADVVKRCHAFLGLLFWEWLHQFPEKQVRVKYFLKWELQVQNSSPPCICTYIYVCDEGPSHLEPT